MTNCPLQIKSDVIKRINHTSSNNLDDIIKISSAKDINMTQFASIQNLGRSIYPCLYFHREDECDSPSSYLKRNKIEMFYFKTGRSNNCISIDPQNESYPIRYLNMNKKLFQNINDLKFWFNEKKITFGYKNFYVQIGTHCL